MGKLEKQSKSQTRRTEVQHAVLSAVAVAGVLSIGLVAPNAIQAMARLGLLPHERQGEVVRSATSRLRRKGLLKFENGRYSLTREGEKILRHWHGESYKIEKPRRWDRKWRVVIFDIPEKKRKVRDQVRLIISRAGFERLQDSVWVYPYDCEDVIGLLKTDLGIDKDMLYMIVDQIENDKYLRTAFNLP